jgi:hypothetical protein
MLEEYENGNEQSQAGNYRSCMIAALSCSLSERDDDAERAGHNFYKISCARYIPDAQQTM